MENQSKEDKVWVTIDRTINTGNYESIKISAGLSRTIIDKDDPEELLKDTCDEVFEIIKERSIKYKRSLKKL